MERVHFGKVFVKLLIIYWKFIGNLLEILWDIGAALARLCMHSSMKSKTAGDILTKFR